MDYASFLRVFLINNMKIPKFLSILSTCEYRIRGHLLTLHSKNKKRDL